MERSVWCTVVCSVSASGSSLRPSAEVAFECEQGPISVPSIRYTINGQNAKPRPNQWFGAARPTPGNTLTYSPRRLCAASQPWQGRWEWPLTLSVTLEIWPELWTLSGSGKSIPDYPPQVIDASAVLRIRPLEFQLIRHSEGRRREEGWGCGCNLLTSSAAQSVQVRFVMIVNDIMMNITIELQCLHFSLHHRQSAKLLVVWIINNCKLYVPTTLLNCFPFSLSGNSKVITNWISCVLWEFLTWIITTVNILFYFTRILLHN